MDKTVSFYLAYAYKGFLAYSSERLKEYKISFGQLPFIVYIGKFKDCTISDLKRDLRCDWGHASRAIDKLLQNEIINKVVDSNDKRLCHLSLTKKGEEAFRVSHEVFNAWDMEYLKDFNEEEKEILYKLLRKLTNKEKGYYELRGNTSSN